MQLHIEVDNEELEEFYSNVMKNVKKIRKEKGVTQTELSLSIGHKSVSTIAKIEAGLEDKHYNLEQLYKISKVVNVNITEFFK